MQLQRQTVRVVEESHLFAGIIIHTNRLTFNSSLCQLIHCLFHAMPELLDELSIARSGGTLKKVLETYKKKDLLILDEWLIRPLSPQESYDMLEIVEARCHKSTIFCTQYESEGWYTRIDPNPESDSPVSEAIMDRIIHNAYEVLVDGRVSMRERKGLKATREGGGQDV